MTATRSVSAQRIYGVIEGSNAVVKNAPDITQQTVVGVYKFAKRRKAG